MKINFKSKSFWVSLASAIVIFVQSIAELFGYSFKGDAVLNGVNAICGALIFLGILNNTSAKTENKEKQTENTNQEE